MATTSAAQAENGLPVASRIAREGHDRQCYVRNIIEERTERYVFDFLPDQCEWEDTDQRGNAYHDCNIKKDIILHFQNPP